MGDSFADALPWSNQENDSIEDSAETTPSGTESVRWVVVAENLNPGEAVIVKGRLESEGIPAIVQQEAMGIVLGLTVGPLGAARLLVPEPHADNALTILAETFETDEAEAED